MGKKKKKKRQNDPPFDFQKAVGLHQNGQFEEALVLYEKIIETNPGHVDATYLSGVIYHQTARDEKAIELIKRAIELNPDNPDYFATLVKAYHNSGLKFQENGDYETAFFAYSKALEINPDFHLSLNNAGMIYQMIKEYDLAEKYFQRAVETDPRFYAAWVNLGNLQQSKGETDKALKSYQKALSLEPASWEVFNNIGTIFKKQRSYTDAIIAFDQAISLKPDYGDAFYNRGTVYHELEKFDAADADYQRCIELLNGHAGAWNNRGNIFKKNVDFENAGRCYFASINVDPNYAPAYINIGVLQYESNRLESALEYFEKALALSPENIDVLYNTALVFLRLRMYDKSLDLLTAAGGKAPDSFAISYTSGVVCDELKDYPTAIDYYKKALTNCPGSLAAADQLLMIMQKCCLWDDSACWIKKLEALKQENGSDSERPFHTLSRYERPDELLDAARACSDEISLKVSGLKKEYDFTHRKLKKDKLRIAYLSNSFSNHPGGQLIAGLFDEHDRNGFEIFCFSYGPDDGSYYRKKIEKTCDKFVDITLTGHVEAADLIYKHSIDILVDLRGHTADSRLEIPALRPAPVQMVYLGFPGTSGAGFFDYILADEVVVPFEQNQYYSETVLRLPHSYQVNDINQPVSEKIFTRKECGLPEDGFVFCSFNNSYKYEPVMFRCWMEILKQRTGSVLWLLKSNDLMEEQLKKEAEKAGVESSRLIFANKIPKPEHLARHSLADLGLDTRIYNGHTSTSDALIAGVPVITLPGNTFPSRVSASILKAVGLDELVVDSIEAYQQTAVEYSADIDDILALKTKLDQHKSEKPLFDTGLFARELEKKYISVWENFLTEKNNCTRRPS